MSIASAESEQATIIVETPHMRFVDRQGICLDETQYTCCVESLHICSVQSKHKGNHRKGGVGEGRAASPVVALHRAHVLASNTAHVLRLKPDVLHLNMPKVAKESGGRKPPNQKHPQHKWQLASLTRGKNVKSQSLPLEFITRHMCVDTRPVPL